MKKIISLLLISNLIFGCSSDKSDYKQLLKQGQEAYLAGKYREASRLFNEGLKINPSDHDLLYYLGLSYQKEYVYDSSLFFLKKVDLLYPKDREVNRSIYQVAPQAEDWEIAIKAIKFLIVSGDPEDKYLEELARFYRNRDMLINSLYYYRKLIVKEPDKLERYLQISNVAAAVDSLTTASAYNDTALEKFGPLDELISNKGTIHAYRGEFADAEKIFRNLLLKDSINLYYKTNLASVLSEQENRAKRLEGLKLFEEIKAQSSSTPTIDSIITALKQDLNK